MASSIRRLAPRFRLRTLIIAIAIVGIACALVELRVERGRREHAAADAVQRGGTAMFYYDYQFDDEGRSLPNGEPSAPKYLRSILGDEFFNHVVYALIDQLGDGSGLKNLKHLPYLGVLDIGSDDSAYGDKLNDSSIAFLSDLRALPLKRVGIGQCALTDRGLVHLDGLPNVEYLALLNTRCTGSGLRFLPSPERLRVLSFESSELNDEGMRQIGRLTGLQELLLRSSNLTDTRLRFLAPLKNLKELDISGCPVSDGGIKTLSALTGLYRLEVSRTRISQRGIETLQELMPGTTIVPRPRPAIASGGK